MTLSADIFDFESRRAGLEAIGHIDLELRQLDRLSGLWLAQAALRRSDGELLLDRLLADLTGEHVIAGGKVYRRFGRAAGQHAGDAADHRHRLHRLRIVGWVLAVLELVQLVKRVALVDL